MPKTRRISSQSSFRRHVMAVVAGIGCVLWVGGVDSKVTWAQGKQGVFVPSFWDPHRRPDKPDLGAIRIIRFLTDDDFPPFHFALPDGSLAGFNVDLARAICEELKVACTVQPRRWDTLTTSLKNGRGDAAIASLAITEEARRELAFTSPYFKTPARFVALKTGRTVDTNPEDLASKKIGVEANSAHEAYLKAFYTTAVIKNYKNAASLRAGLKGGEVDLLFGDGVPLAFWLNGTDANNCCVFRGGPYMESYFFGEGAGIAVRRDNLVLRNALDYALQRIVERGAFAEIYLKYFPISIF